MMTIASVIPELQSFKPLQRIRTHGGDTDTYGMFYPGESEVVSTHQETPMAAHC